MDDDIINIPEQPEDGNFEQSTHSELPPAENPEHTQKPLSLAESHEETLISNEPVLPGDIQDTGSDQTNLPANPDRSQEPLILSNENVEGSIQGEGAQISLESNDKVEEPRVDPNDNLASAHPDLSEEAKDWIQEKFDNRAVAGLSNQETVPSITTNLGNQKTIPSTTTNLENQETIPAVLPPVSKEDTIPSFDENINHEDTIPPIISGLGDEETIPPLERPVIDENLDSPTSPVDIHASLTRAHAVRPGSSFPPPPPSSGTYATLPRRVEEVDLEATKVSLSAYRREDPASVQGVQELQVRRGGETTRAVPVKLHQPEPAYEKSNNQRGNGKKYKKPLGCLLRLFIVLLFLGVLGLLGIGSFLVYKYFTIAAALPPVEELREHASKFETTRILDRDGNVIYEIIDPNAGKRTFVPLERISPYLIAATLATEDKDFYAHPGFDPIAIARSLWANYTSGGIVSGASTITQQVARTLLLDPEERYARTVERKAQEIVLSAEITRKYSKEEILELYLNENNYGKHSYGVQAAAETYFNTTAEKLTIGQAAFLAGIPQSPSIYDIEANRDGTLNRFRTVIVLTYELSQERGCIYVSTAQENVCVGQQEAVDAVREIESYTFDIFSNERISYPHWVVYVKQQLEAMYDSATIYRSGFSVTTTIDPDLQRIAEQQIAYQLAQMTDKNATNGALVAIRPSTGEILAMVGSADYYNKDISGQVNMAISPRQPGSAIKPFTYVGAFEKGWTASTLIWDVPSGYPPSGYADDQRAPYEPVNYDGRFHGPVTVRSALANSYNIPAVEALQYVGIYDNTATPQKDGFIALLERLGVTTLTREDYGLALTLGGGDVSLLELTGAYSVLANSGRKVAPVAITKIVDASGNIVYEYQPPIGDQVVRSEHAYIISSILSDNQARAPMFGTNSVLNLGFTAAAKTGTTNDYRDNWTMGYTPDIVAGVWVGNADYTPMQNTSGLSGAAPIWAAFMKSAVDELVGGTPTPYTRPAGVVDRITCLYSGTEPSQWCPQQRTEIFAYDQLPQPASNDLWREVRIDTWTGYLASAVCSEFEEELFALNVTDPEAVRWILETEDGRKWAEQLGFKQPIFFTPSRECNANDSRPVILFAGISENQTITSSPLAIYALVKVNEPFRDYFLEFGIGENPSEWKLIYEGGPVSDQPLFLTDWDLTGLPVGKVTLRLRMRSDRNTYAERKIHLILQVPTATPTPTPTATATPTATSTPTATPTPTITPTGTSTPTDTATPTLTPTTETPVVNP